MSFHVHTANLARQQAQNIARCVFVSTVTAQYVSAALSRANFVYSSEK